MATTVVARRNAPIVAGTTNQVIVSVAGVMYTLSLPQSIATASSPQFANIGIGIAANALAYITTAASTAAKASFVLTPGVAYTGTLGNGMIWFEATNYRIRVTKNAVATDFITSTNNHVLKGTPTTGVVVADGATGDLSTQELGLLFVTDSDIITAINGATFATTKLATITPANSKVIHQGQMYYNATLNVYYIAIANNQVYILSGDVVVDSTGKKWRETVSTSGVITTVAV